MKRIRSLIAVALCVLIALLAFAGCSNVIGSNDIVILYTSGAKAQAESPQSYSAVSYIKNQAGKVHNLTALLDCGGALSTPDYDIIQKGEYAANVLSAVGYDLINLDETDLSIKNEAEAAFDELDSKFITAEDDAFCMNFSGVKVAFVSVPADISDSSTVSAVQGKIDAACSDYAVLIGELDSEGAKALVSSLSGSIAAVLSSSEEAVSQKLLENKDGCTVLYSSAGVNLQYVGQLTITSSGTVTTTLVETDKEDEDIELLEKSLKDEYDQKLNKSVQTLSNAVEDVNSNGIVTLKNRETAIGDLVADAFKNATGADIALVSASEIQAGLKEGDVSVKDILSCLPNGGEVVTLTLSGNEIATLLEIGAVNTSGYFAMDGEPYGTSDNFLQVSGLKYTINTNVGSTVQFNEDGTLQTIGDTRKATQIAVVNGEETKELDAQEQYTVAVSSNMLKTNPLLKITSGNSTTGELLDYNALLNFINELQGGVEEYSAPSGRITII